jgi:hypothetical protein
LPHFAQLNLIRQSFEEKKDRRGPVMITSRKDTDWKNFEALAPLLLGLTPAELLSKSIAESNPKVISCTFLFEGGQL